MTERNQTHSTDSSYGNIVVTADKVFKKPRTDESFPYAVREIAALQLLKKAKVPYIVDLNDIMDDGTIEIEKYDGDLYDMQHICLLTEDDVIHTIYRILIAMTNMRNLNISHRDIKPDNILINKEGTKMAVCDLGLARYFSCGQIPEQSTPSVQTAYFRAPEMTFQELNQVKNINPWTMDIWSLGVTALKLLDLVDYLPPCIAEDELTLKEMFDIYEQIYGNNGSLRQYASENDFLMLICDMLIIDPYVRPEPSVLLSNSVFDEYRQDNEDVIIDAEKFNMSRVKLLLDVLPVSGIETNPNICTMLSEISHYQFNNVESAQLAVCIVYLLPVEILENTDLMTIIALSAAIFDSELVDMSIPDTMTLLKCIDYDVLLPVTDPTVTQRLDKLLSTV